MVVRLAALTPIDALEIEQTRLRYPDLPAEYWQLLEQFGWGAIERQGAPVFMIYSGPVEAAEVYGPSCAATGVWLVGDDMAGNTVGYDAEAEAWLELDARGERSTLDGGLMALIGRFVRDLDLQERRDDT